MVLIENFDPNYLLFERAEALVREGLSPRVIIAVHGNGAVPKGIAELMSRAAHLENFEIVPIPEQEPITLNTVMDLKAYLLSHSVSSILVVTDGFRSQRAFLIYDRLVRPAGIRFSIIPVFGLKDVHNWRKSWHGIQDVTLEFGKLWYYRLFVLPAV